VDIGGRVEADRSVGVSPVGGGLAQAASSASKAAIEIVASLPRLEKFGLPVMLCCTE
jgi:hypothetical protein